MKKRIFSIITMCIMIVCCCINPIKVKANDTSNKISVDDALKVAKVHIINMICKDESISWAQGVKVEKVQELYNLDDEISAYYISLANEDGDERGYVIVSAEEDKIPIIEYAVNGESFLDVAYEDVMKNKNARSIQSKKTYYLGNQIYAFELKEDGDSSFYKILDDGVSQCSISDLTMESDEKNLKYKNIWNNYKQEYNNLSKNGNVTRGSNPPDDGGFITKPSDYESGYNNYFAYTISNGWQAYFIMTDFSYGGVCAPTAATNLCYYWALRNQSQYGALCNGTWAGTYNSLYEYMETSDDSGTYDVDVAPAYERYFNERGFSCSSNFYKGTDSGLLVINELNKDRPCHLMVHSHNTYGDHSVVAIGYEYYNYGGEESSYIQIVDGWTRLPERYVWGGCYGTWNYVTVDFN